ncbi:MAG: phosphoenolpyruvate--protein phosphotransferase [Akkermansiaceae bacterium]|nr:phosphoenolpyruvate--protein phosphotransferase [Akkermansiaceae bacterium]MCF7733340.1 phosphoenolpyruvate--protein phosphotransferase [Akkermansiaceae bacterium]
MEPKPPHSEVTFLGIPASPGIAIGPIYAVSRGFAAPEVFEIEPSQVPHEQERFSQALDRTRQQLQELQQRMEHLAGSEPGDIFEVHIMLLEDPAVVKRVHAAIASRCQNAEYVFFATMQTYLEAMRRVADPYLRERTVDIEDVALRVLRAFRNDNEPRHPGSDGPHILMAFDLTPSDTVGMDRRHILGFVTEQGSVNSHTAILARAFGIPAVVGLEGSILDVTTLSLTVLDGYAGKLIVHPKPETLEHYRKLVIDKQRIRAQVESHRDVATETTDGQHVTVSANMELLEELELVTHSGAKGIGLYRTEFTLLSGGEIPDELAQAHTYTRVVEAISPHRVIIRTLDAGGDKLPVEPLTEPEPNPFLGWRGIRVSLARPAMFRDQLRAILRASGVGPVAMMFPMVSGISEVECARELIARCMDELDREGVPFDRAIPVGIMVEVPSAAVCADILASLVDFFSIGTNDLIQYTVAADRVNPHVADLYRPTHPAVIRLIKNTIDAGRDHGIWTGICGEMAGDIRLTPLLIGLGARELSVGPQQVPRVGEAIRTVNHAECVALADEAMRQTRSHDILNSSLEIARKCYGYLLD